MNEATHLGKHVNYPQHYAPEVLVAVPRALNRENYGLHSDCLPFVGLDIWHAYELSFLTDKGLPVVGMLKISYQANTHAIVESKSLKLYLNSLNMHCFGSTVSESISHAVTTIKKDLSALLGQAVEVNFFDRLPESPHRDFDAYTLLEALPDIEHFSFDTYTEQPAYLVADPNCTKELKISSNLLRSNCKITHQPDWGSVFIHINGSSLPALPQLLQYLVSIRNENHFHEEICEMIYTRLWTNFKPEILAVTCIYTRRGGIDICPSRASHSHLLPLHLVNNQTLSLKLLRQ